MTEERLVQIESRLGILEQLTQGLEARVSRLEPHANVAAPPVLGPLIAQLEQRSSAPSPNPYASSPRFDVPGLSVPKVSVDTEYQLGAQWLPRIGAGLLVLGIAYLIALAVSNGWITPPMLFGGAVVLCLAFIGFGQRLRDEREDFGQVLTGIGSCGFFATLAGGHIYQHLYNGEAMVAGFMLWGLANLGYAMWRESRSFLAIGIIGGFLGSSMPLSKDAFYLSLGLHAVILAVGAAIVVRHRFGVSAIGLWVASMLALVPIGFASELDWMVKVGALEISTLVCVIAYVLGREKEDATADQVLIAGLVGTVSLVAFGIRPGLDGSAHTLILALACGLFALAFRKDRIVSQTWTWTAVTLALILAPWGLERLQACFTYSSIAIVAGLSSLISRREEPLAISTLALPASVVLYLIKLADGGRLESSTEALVLTMVLVAACSLAAGLRRSESDPRNLIAFLIGWGAVSRLGAILLALPSDFRLASFSVTVAWIVYGAILLIIGFIANLRNYRFASLTVLLGAVGKVLLVDMATATPELRVAVLIGVGLALVAGGYAYIQRRSKV